MPQFIPNLGLYMVEAALRASRLPGLEVKVWDLTGATRRASPASSSRSIPTVIGLLGVSVVVSVLPRSYDPGERTTIRRG